MSYKFSSASQSRLLEIWKSKLWKGRIRFTNKLKLLSYEIKL